MRLPETVKIGAIQYEVVIGAKDVELARDNLYAQIDFDRSVIDVCTTVTRPLLISVFLHEVLHGIARHQVLDRAWGANTEDYVERLEQGLMMVFVDNQALLDLFKIDAPVGIDVGSAALPTVV